MSTTKDYRLSLKERIRTLFTGRLPANTFEGSARRYDLLKSEFDACNQERVQMEQSQADEISQLKSSNENILRDYTKRVNDKQDELGKTQMKLYALEDVLTEKDKRIEELSAHIRKSESLQQLSEKISELNSKSSEGRCYYNSLTEEGLSTLAKLEQKTRELRIARTENTKLKKRIGELEKKLGDLPY